MLAPIIKKSEELSLLEIKELNDICRLINNQNPIDHIEKNHIEKTNPIFYLFKVDSKIVAFQSFNLFHKKTPFAKNKIPIMFVGLSYKDPNTDSLIKNYAKKSNLHFMKSHLGRYWFFKKFLVVFLTNNPKLAERSAKVVYKHFPSFEYSTPNEVLEFGKNLLHEELNLKETPLNNNLIIPKNYHGESLITREWDSMYKANNNLQNKFFLEECIISKKENEYYLTGNLMLFLGLISPKVILKKIFSKILPN